MHLRLLRVDESPAAERADANENDLAVESQAASSGLFGNLAVIARGL